MSLAPIALFAFKRPEHLARTLESLQANPLAQASELYLYSDGPRNSEDRSAVEEVRILAHSVKGFKRVHLHEQAENLGLSRSVIGGVTELSKTYGRVIVLEDDLVVAPGFLSFMNQVLHLYQDERKIMQVSGYMFPVERPERLGSTFLCKVPASWGWGTWERAWGLLELDSAKLLSSLEDAGRRYEFNLKGAYPYFEHLGLQATGKIDVWGVRWYASMFARGGLCLYPSQSLVKNIGMDGSGVHCGTSRVFDVEVSTHDRWRFPDRIQESDLAMESIRDFLTELHEEKKQSSFCKLFPRVRDMVRKLKRITAVY